MRRFLISLRKVTVYKHIRMATNWVYDKTREHNPSYMHDKIQETYECFIFILSRTIVRNEDQRFVRQMFDIVK